MGTTTGRLLIDQIRDKRPRGRSTEQHAQTRFRTNETPTSKFTSGELFLFSSDAPEAYCDATTLGRLRFVSILDSQLN
jgi:hypothetical protein